MELFSFSLSGAPLLLSASENSLFVHPMQNERLGHPLLLCSNYKSGFSGCVLSQDFETWNCGTAGGTERAAVCGGLGAAHGLGKL